MTNRNPKLDVLKATVRSIFSREVDLICGYLAFTTILSIVPVVVLMLVAGQILGNPASSTYSLADRFMDLITPENIPHIKQVIFHLYHSVNIRKFSLGATAVLVVLIFHKIHVLRDSFERLIGTKPGRKSLMVEFVIFLVIIAAFPLVFSMFDAFILQHLPKNQAWIAYLSKLGGSFVIIFLLMRVFLPLRTPRKSEIWLAFLGSVALIIGNRLFGMLSSHFYTINHVYGVFTAIPLFLIWIYIFWRVLITCVILASDKYLHDSHLLFREHANSLNQLRGIDWFR